MGAAKFIYVNGEKGGKGKKRNEKEESGKTRILCSMDYPIMVAMFVILLWVLFPTFLCGIPQKVNGNCSNSEMTSG